MQTMREDQAVRGTGTLRAMLLFSKEGGTGGKQLKSKQGREWADAWVGAI